MRFDDDKMYEISLKVDGFVLNEMADELTHQENAKQITLGNTAIRALLNSYADARPSMYMHTNGHFMLLAGLLKHEREAA